MGSAMLANRLRNVLAHAQAIAKNPVKRRKFRRGSIVAGIALAGAFSFDYLLTGGPDWNPIGAEARQFELVSSAAAAEHRPAAAIQAPRLSAPPLEIEAAARVEEDAQLIAYDPNISAADLLGAPRHYAEALKEEADAAEALPDEVALAGLLDILRPRANGDFGPLWQAAPSATPWLP